MEISQTGQMLFALLRAAINQRYADAKLFDGISAEQWLQIYKLSARQGVIAIAWDGVLTLPRELQPTTALRIQWAMSVENLEKRYAHQMATAANLSTLYAQHGIEMMVLKGLGLSELYPVREHRECGDIDIYLGNNYEYGNKVIEKMGIEVGYENPKHSHFTYEGVTIENHKTFLNVELSRRDRYLNTELLRLTEKRGRELECINNITTPPATANAIFLMRHAARHFQEGLVARHMIDWACFLRHNAKSIDFDLFNAMMIATKLDLFTAVFTNLSLNILDMPIAEVPEYSHHTQLEKKVLAAIISYNHNSDAPKGLFARILYKFRRFTSNRWKYKQILHENFLQSIWYSLVFHMKNPDKI